MESKHKHLEFIQGAISRMATNSFLFKGWAISLAAALSGFGVVNNLAVLLGIALVCVGLFWGLDGYYLWLERGFIRLHQDVAARSESDINFSMEIDKTDAFRRWLGVCFRPHLLAFYGVIAATDTVGIIYITRFR